jgi:uncharacterized protein (TIGR03083 family)
MEFARLLDCLAADAAGLRKAASDQLDAPVPSCPGWTVTDLVQHVAQVYLHKTECMRLGKFPDPWPPDPGSEPPLARLDRAYAGLVAEFADRDPGSPAPTWYGPDQTVGFWIRRMAQETVIHRVDAELARGPAGPIPADLAVDGIDEVLDCFLRYGTQEWPEDFTLPAAETPPVLVKAGGHGWSVQAAPSGVTVSPPSAGASAQVDGDPAAVLRWLWGRAGDDQVTVSGDHDLVESLRRLLHDATQ